MKSSITSSYDELKSITEKAPFTHKKLSTIVTVCPKSKWTSTIASLQFFVEFCYQQNQDKTAKVQ